MNERIKELAEQAGFIRFSPEEDPHTPIDWSSNYDAELNLFADIILQKCISELALIGVHNFDNEDIVWTVETAIDNIKNKFGIEE